jgi:very-short-patch-repair endonuclease
VRVSVKLGLRLTRAARNPDGYRMDESNPSRKPQADSDHLAFARQLRRDKTEAEARLWSRLRGRRLSGYRFRRQQPCGPYTLDFLCHERALVVELDGGQHSEAGQAAHDATRTAYLRTRGLTVIRFWNHHVLAETDAVCRTILRALTEPGSLEGRIS